MVKQRFSEISSRAFEHPLDRTALSALQRVKGVDWLVRKFINAIGEKRLRLLFLASAVRVTEEQLPEIRKLYDDACAVLDIEEKPELFVAQDFFVNAAAIGVDKPFIVLTSSLTELLDGDELQCVLGHELGHVLSGHALYTTLLMLLVNLWYVFLGVPGGIYAIIAVRMALLEWSRKAELTADRAGLLVSQDPELSYRVDMKIAGGLGSKDMQVAEFERQAEEYESHGDMLDGVLKLVNLLGKTHPFPVLRVAELKRWVESGDYEKIMAGDYPRRGETPEETWLDDVKATASQYKDSFASSKDPFFEAIRDFSSGAAAAGAGVVDFFRNAFTSSEEKPDEKAD